MYKKIESIKRLMDMGVNTHRQFFPQTFLAFLDVVVMKCSNVCTVRTDHEKITDDLPFYVVTPSTKLAELHRIWRDSTANSYKLIVSDGLKYDGIQQYNMVVNINQDGTFLFDASDLKIPLRHMYRYPLLSCSGSICDEVSQWEVINNRYGMDRTLINRDLLSIYLSCSIHGLYGNWLELTKYPKPVGRKKEDIVYWQIR